MSAVCCLAIFTLAVFIVAASSQQCVKDFLMEPGVGATSPLDCNIIGINVQLQCQIEGERFEIGWFFTTDPAQAGRDTSNQITGGMNGYNIINSAQLTPPTSITSDLVINSFNRSTHSGYYWCRITRVDNGVPQAINPSTVLLIEPPRQEELRNVCSSAVFISDMPLGCAESEFAETMVRTANIMFTNMNLVTSPPPTSEALDTTEPPTTMMTTKATTILDNTMEETTSEEETLPPTTASDLEETAATTADTGNNTVRTAIIWFSVGAVALILIVGAIILCACAIARN